MQAKKGGWEPDYELVASLDRKKYTLLIEVKASGEPKYIAQFAGRLDFSKASNEGYPVLVAPFISSRGRGMCKELGIGFIDFAGNAYLRFNGVLIERWGKENPAKDNRILKKLFSRKATWVIRNMLSSPKREWKFSELASEAGVSQGQAYKVIGKLEEQGYVERKRGSITLSKPGELLDAWAGVYNIKDQKITGYYCPMKGRDELFESLRSVKPDNFALTLGAAASIVAPFVRTSDVYLYVPTTKDDIKSHLKLTPVEFGGNVYLIEPSDEGILFGSQRIDGISLVSNLQLYLDLFNYPQRGREQAEHLRDKLLEF